MVHCFPSCSPNFLSLDFIHDLLSSLLSVMVNYSCMWLIWVHWTSLQELWSGILQRHLDSYHIWSCNKSCPSVQMFKFLNIWICSLHIEAIISLLLLLLSCFSQLIQKLLFSESLQRKIRIIKMISLDYL